MCLVLGLDLDVSVFFFYYLGLKEVNVFEQFFKSCFGNKKVCDCWGLLVGVYIEKRRKYIGEV